MRLDGKVPWDAVTLRSRAALPDPYPAGSSVPSAPGGGFVSSSVVRGAFGVRVGGARLLFDFGLDHRVESSRGPPRRRDVGAGSMLRVVVRR